MLFFVGLFLSGTGRVLLFQNIPGTLAMRTWGSINARKSHLLGVPVHYQHVSNWLPFLYIIVFFFEYINSIKTIVQGTFNFVSKF